MRIGCHNNIASFTVYLSLFLCGSIGFAIGQTSSTKKAEIVNLDANISVSVVFEVRAADKQLVIPVCREKEEDGQSLCIAHLQRYIGEAWKNAMPRKDSGAVLGFYGKEYWKPLVILPGKRASFRYGLSKEFFGIRTGERLRIMLEVWDSVESMTNKDEPDSYLASPVFECP
ncbi:MAG: hypothetical protein WCA21_16035 [Terracidiphilus sp.]